LIPIDFFLGLIRLELDPKLFYCQLSIFIITC